MPLEPIRKLRGYKPKNIAPGYFYKPLFGDSAVAFVERLKHHKGRWKGMPFELIDWQEQIIRDLFGIVSKSDECRQYKRAYIELPKKNGKSELAAAIALLLLCCDHEYGGEIYGCAMDQKQARIVFNVALHMVEQNEYLRENIKYNRSTSTMTFKPLGSFYQVVSADSGNKDGLNSHGIIFDELHAQKNEDFFKVMTTSSGLSREQPLQFIITTAGFDRNSIGWREHQYANQVRRGDIIDPTFYPVIFDMDEKDDWQSEAVWRKVNPSFGITFEPDAFRAEFEKAKIDLSAENSFRRLNLNEWTKQYSRWMPMDKYDACNQKLDDSFLHGKRCYGGLDLSSSDDMTALVLCFPPEDEEDKFYLLPFFWIPREFMEKRIRKDRAPYDRWAHEGHLFVTDGAVIDYDFVQAKLVELSKKYDIKDVAFDKWGAQLLSQRLKKDGITVSGYRQGYQTMSPASKNFLTLIQKGCIAHGGHPVLRWNFDNAVVKIDEAGNIKPDKSKASDKIDGAVAAIMAADLAMRDDKKRGGYAMAVIDINGGQTEYY